MTEQSILLEQDTTADEASLIYMLKLAGPMVVTTVSFTVMQFVDRFMVSRLGSDALAAILPASFVSFVPGGFAMGAISSLNTYVSQCLGRGNRDECSNYFWQATFMSCAYFFLVLLIMWPLAPGIFKAMGQPPSVIRMEVIYLRIILYAQLVVGIYWSSNQFFMGIHRPIITMYSSICAHVVNITANYILIFGKLGVPAMGIAGAAWGTCLGMAVGAFINLAVFLSPGVNDVFKTRSSFRFDFAKMYDLIRIGFPAGLGLMVNVAFWGVILVGLVGRFGTEALAATSAVLAYTNLSVMPIVGISTALTASVGKMIGRGRKDLAIRQNTHCLKIGLAYMGFLGICFFIFRIPMMRFWSTDEKVISAGARLLVLAAIYQVFHAARVIYGGSLRGAGDTVWLAIVSGVGSVVILGIGGFLIVEFFPSFGPAGPWLAATLSIVAVGLANHWRFKSGKWMHIDLFKSRVVNVPIQNGAAAE
jgi:MATE family multidrug resistance protein